MAGANSNIQLAGLDFDTIKFNLKNFLKSQDTFKDYNFEGSGLSVLLDILAYNTQYNAFYLNMVGNEMFLDTALQRSSVVSHAKLLNYIPRSSTAPTAIIDISTTNTTDGSVTLPAYTNFLSESVGGTNYNFVTTHTTTSNVVGGVASFSNIELKQGIPVSYNFVVDSTTNPTYTFELPDSNIDTSTIMVYVYQSSTSSSYDVYDLSQNYITLDSSSKVYFLQESLNGNYEILFGDGILGKQLIDGNLVVVNYVITQGSSSSGANNFVLMDAVSGFGTTTITPIISASNGSGKESMDSIKFQAPKAFSAQNRAVTKDDYVTIIKQNKIGLTFDDVNVWGGEENIPPVYGKVFICMKPTSGYLITDAQKQQLVDNTIKPLSVMTVEPTIIDPDYTYLKLNINVAYDAKKTNLSSTELQQLIKNIVSYYSNSNLNKFSSTFSVADVAVAIKNASNAIITSDISIQVQKKIYPVLSSSLSYKLVYGVPLKRNTFQSGINSSPSLKFKDPTNTTNTLTDVYIEEVPVATTGIDSVSIINPGFGYSQSSPPTVTIVGDGSGATAEAVINIDGSIAAINILTSGSGYSDAVVIITPASNDTTGQLGSAVVNLQGKYGTLRTYYYNKNNVKTILDENAGTIDYANGLVTLIALAPLEVNNSFGQLTISAIPTTTIISSSYNRIVTIDPNDPVSIEVNVTSK